MIPVRAVHLVAATHEQIAFWVNVYNARVLDAVVRRPGLKSVLDVGRALGVPTHACFREQAVSGGRGLSLNDIEHGPELGLSSIFKWYRSDFETAAGSLPAFVQRHWPVAGVVRPDAPIRFMAYDWSLNGHW